MGIRDDAVEIRAQGWRTLAALHGLIETSMEKALQGAASLSVVEYTVLDALARQDGWHMRMQQLGRATALSSSATTRLVNRLEDRGLLTRILCADDRRGIYTELTPSGSELLETARPVHDEALECALAEAALLPELAPLVEALPSCTPRFLPAKTAVLMLKAAAQSHQKSHTGALISLSAYSSGLGGSFQSWEQKLS